MRERDFGSPVGVVGDDWIKIGSGSLHGKSQLANREPPGISPRIAVGIGGANDTPCLQRHNK